MDEFIGEKNLKCNWGIYIFFLSLITWLGHVIWEICTTGYIEKSFVKCLGGRKNFNQFLVTIKFGTGGLIIGFWKCGPLAIYDCMVMFVQLRPWFGTIWNALRGQYSSIPEIWRNWKDQVVAVGWCISLCKLISKLFIFLFLVSIKRWKMIWNPNLFVNSFFQRHINHTARWSTNLG